jgi:DNA primase
VRRTGVREVVLVFDGDEAGRKAGLKALSGLLKLPVSLRVAALPEGRDPGDLLVDPAGAREFAACIEGAQEWFDWCLGGLRAKRGAELTQAVEERFGLILRLEKPLERSARLAEIARFLALPEADVRAQWALFERSQRPAPSPTPETPRPARQSAPASDRMQHAYALLLGALLSDNSLVPLYAHLVSGCPEGELAVLFRKLLELYQHDESGAPLDASALMTALGDDPSRGRAVAFQTLAEEAESPAVLARDQARWIERTRAERGLEALKGLLARPVPEPEDELATLERLHAGLRAVRVPSAAAARSQILTPQESHGRES